MRSLLLLALVALMVGAAWAEAPKPRYTLTSQHCDCQCPAPAASEDDLDLTRVAARRTDGFWLRYDGAALQTIVTLRADGRWCFDTVSPRACLPPGLPGYAVGYLLLQPLIAAWSFSHLGVAS